MITVKPYQRQAHQIQYRAWSADIESTVKVHPIPMDIINKKSHSPVATIHRNRGIVLGLAAMLVMIAPAWGGTDPAQASPSPADMTVVGTPVNALAVTPQDMERAPRKMQFISLGRVTFVSDKWELTETTKHLLDNVSEYLAAHPGAERLLLEAHTDWVGGTGFNDRLSDKRAIAVQGYLESKGIDPRLIRWKGHGEHAPIDENWTRLGRDRNRQVELYAVYLP